ncbi:MAG: CHRD domain-containing protein [Phycisphaerae bacterium]|nr:CHRD domain-containing protein [Gemmatimonadaceae bacterium]
MGSQTDTFDNTSNPELFVFSFSRIKPSSLTAACRLVALGGSLAAMGAVSTIGSAQSWYGTLMGTNEVPPNASAATGFVSITKSGNILSLSLTWSGLIGGNVAAGHIHCCSNPGTNVGVAIGFPGLPSGGSGSYSNTFDLSSATIYTAAFRNNFGGGTAAGAEAALVSGLNAGTAYVNLHNAQFPGGEIRANVVVTPEPASVVMLALGMLGVGVAVRRKRRTVRN